MKVSQPKVLGAGLVALDLVVSPDPTVPVQAWAGGTTGNVMAILAWHGWDSYPIARMNGDPASERVRADLRRWGVKLDLSACTPTSNTPIIVQEIRRTASGTPTHKFSWSCLRCGGWLPPFKPITQHVVEYAEALIPATSVFFFDRVSRATIKLASMAADAGAVVFFEPSGRGDERLFAEALELAHVVKYADERICNLADAVPSKSRVLEVQTLGAAGLRFRTPNRKRGGDRWRSLEGITAERIVDSCGSGDWCSAGVIARTASKGFDGLQNLNITEIKDGLMYGQKLASWNCGFEGARGGMYSSASVEGPTGLRKRRSASVQPSGGPQAGSLIQCPKCDVA